MADPEHATYIALLRGINVSGQKCIKMADLTAHFADFGAQEVRTYIQSGNVIFSHKARASSAIRPKLEGHLRQKLGFAVPTLVFSADELAAIARRNPHDTALPEFGRHMYVCFFEQAPAEAAITRIQSFVSESERLVVTGGAGYVYYAAGLGRARLSSTVIERKLGLATLRNWNTVTALLEMSASAAI